MSDIAPPPLRGPHVDDSETVLRLVWDSDDLVADTGELSTSAFSKRDLGGVDNGLSVDRRILAIKAVIQRRVGIQQEKAEGRSDLNRNAALLSEAMCSDIHGLLFDDSAAKMFATISTPIIAEGEQPANPAHAEIVNISSRNKTSDFNKMRTKLQPVFSKPSALDIVLPNDPIEDTQASSS